MQDTPSPKKKKKFSLESKQYIKVIALGSQTGSIIIYSISHGSVIKTLSRTHASPVNDFVFTKDGKKGYSCSEDMNIVEWDINNEVVIKYDTFKNSFILIQYELAKIFLKFLANGMLVHK